MNQAITVGSTWQHRGGQVYRVLMITNLPDEDRYPKTVVYENMNNRTRWSRRFDDWHRSFTYAPQYKGHSE